MPVKCARTAPGGPLNIISSDSPVTENDSTRNGFGTIFVARGRDTKKREKKVTRFGARENGNDNSFLTIVRAAQRIAQWKLISSCETIARRSACHIKYVLGT